MPPSAAWSSESYPLIEPPIVRPIVRPTFSRAVHTCMDSIACLACSLACRHAALVANGSDALNASCL